MKILLLFSAAVFFVIALVGCETNPNDPESASVSAIPWNKPATWEGSGALGGFAGTH